MAASHVRMFCAFALLLASFSPDVMTQSSGSLRSTPKAVPKSIDGFATDSPLIIDGVVEDVTIVAIPDGVGGQTVYRRCTVRVIEVLKAPDNVQLARRVSVLQRGGSILVSGREVTSSFDDSSGRILASGERVIFAATPWSAQDSLRLLYGSAGILDVRNGLVRANGRGREIAGLVAAQSEDVAAFKNRLKALLKR